MSSSSNDEDHFRMSWRDNLVLNVDKFIQNQEQSHETPEKEKVKSSNLDPLKIFKDFDWRMSRKDASQKALSTSSKRLSNFYVHRP